jgi:aminodeoxyfutalosine synthase
MDAGLKRALEDKVYAGERLSREDGLALFESDDLAWLGRLAHDKRTEVNGDRVLFAASRQLDLAGVDDVVGRARGMRDDDLTEVHIVNAVHTGRPRHYYPGLLRDLRAELPGVGLAGFSAGEILELEKSGGDVLDELTNAGLDSLAAGNGPWEDWSRIHRLAHGKGMKTPASMLYGYDEEPAHRVDHLLRLRELQDETGGFAVFIPLRHRPDSVDGRAAAPAESLKTFAVSRLLFDNVAHVSASTVTHELSVAQLALNFGADEFDGSAAEYHTPDLLNLIWDAGLRPVRRTVRYEVVREYDAAPGFAARRSEPQQVWA